MRNSTLLAIGLAFSLLPAPARAQLLPERGGFDAAGGGWTPTLSARAGWSALDASPSLGAELRLPLPLSPLRPALSVSGDIVFQTGLRERQGMLDVTVGALRPVVLGGGPVVLNSIFHDDPARRATKVGFTLVAGIRAGRVGPLTSEISLRLIRVEDLHPRFLMLTLGYPLRTLITGR